MGGRERRGEEEQENGNGYGASQRRENENSMRSDIGRNVMPAVSTYKYLTYNLPK